MSIIKTGTLTATSKVVTGLDTTADIVAGLFVYGDGVPVDTAIESVDSTTQITMSNAATKNGSKSLEISSAQVGVYHERQCAQADAKDIIDERGEVVEIIYRKETNVTRGRYGSIKQRTQTTKMFLRSYPISYNPSRDALDKAGIREEVDATMKMAVADWDIAGIDFKDIGKIRTTVKIKGDTFEIRDKVRDSQFADSFLYYLIGLVKL